MNFFFSIFICSILLLETSCSHAAPPSPERKAKILAKKRARRHNYNSRIKVMLDPGHGGNKGGTCSTDKKCKEKDYTLKTALKVRQYLKRMGYSVIMTRDKDEFVSLQKRVDKSKSSKARVFVSIHYNHAKNKNASGIEIYYCRNSKNGKNLAYKTRDQVIKRTKYKYRKTKPAMFRVLRNTTMPAVLIEGGFMSNRNDMKKLRDPKYINDLSLGIARGIDNYFHPKFSSPIR